MKRFLWLLGAIFLLTCAVAGETAVKAASEEKVVDVMFLHDTHSHLNEFATVEDGQSAVLGGFARISTLIKEKKQHDPDTLLLDAGDFSMGTLVQVLFEEEAAEIRMLGELGIDVTTFGNHEFDYKAAGLSGMLEAAVESKDPLPSLAVCNVDWEGMEETGLTPDQKLLKEAFDLYGVCDYVMVCKNGVNIAVIGVFGQDCLKCVPNCPLVFKDPVRAVSETVEEIRTEENADMIVCVSHSGTWEEDNKSEDEILAKSVPELDLIISGHTHTRLEEPLAHGDTYIVSAAEYGKYLGSLSMRQKEDGRWQMDTYSLLPVDQSVPEDEQTREKINGLMARIDEAYLKQFELTREQVLCSNRIDFAQPEKSKGNTEWNLGSIMADAYTYSVEKLDHSDTHPVDVAVVPAGTIRDTYAVGDVTTESVFHSFSLGIGEDGIAGYPLISVYLTGEELALVAEIDASISDFMSTARLYTDGLYWKYNPKRMILNKVTEVTLCDSEEVRKEPEDEKLYRVVTDFYSSQMLGSVTDMSYGLLSIVPKFADGTPIEHYEDAVIKVDGRELKAWNAIAGYMQSFEDTDGDGVGDVPQKYAAPEGRKVIENSSRPGDLLKNPNKFFFLILAVVLIALFVVMLLVLAAVKISKKYLLKRKTKSNK